MILTGPEATSWRFAAKNDQHQCDHDRRKHHDAEYYNVHRYKLVSELALIVFVNDRVELQLNTAEGHEGKCHQSNGDEGNS